VHNKRRDSWELEDAVISPNPENKGGRGSVEATTYISSVGEYLLRDTVIYCAAEKYGLEELKRLALRKQGLQSGIEVATILRSARYAYDNTPDSDSRLRAHYLALIIRCRKTFKRSGTMQTEMESGGKLFFDLFVALCNHVDDIVEMGYVLFYLLLFPDSNYEINRSFPQEFQISQDHLNTIAQPTSDTQLGVFVLVRGYHVISLHQIGTIWRAHISPSPEVWPPFR
jgi:hypothetical protein